MASAWECARNGHSGPTAKLHAVKDKGLEGT
jgi:hypothetical protein